MGDNSAWIQIHDISGMKSERMIVLGGMIVRSRAFDCDGKVVSVTQTFVPMFSSNVDPEVALASALAHRACTGSEHDPTNGKLHGYCIVCGVPWPCETARRFM